MATVAAEQVSAGGHGTLILFGYKSCEVGMVYFAVVALVHEPQGLLLQTSV